MVLQGVVKYQTDPPKFAYCGLEEPGKGVHVKLIWTPLFGTTFCIPNETIVSEYHVETFNQIKS